MGHLDIIIQREVNGVVSDVIAVKPTASSGQSKKIMGDNVTTLTFELNKIIDFQIGDTANIFGETYRLNRMPVVLKKGLYDYEYTLLMDSAQYDLQNAQFMFYDANNILQEGDFTLTGTATTFIDLVVSNINRISTRWARGGVIKTDYKTLGFSKEDCLSVLGRIAKEFGTEFYVENRMIHLAQLIKQTPWKFRYGKNKGLYDITRMQPDGQRIITRLYAFGSEKNLPADYPSSRLRLAGGYTHLISNLTWTVSGMTRTFNFTLPTLTTVTEIQVEFRRLGSTIWGNYATTSSPASFPFYGTGDFEVRFKSFAEQTLVATTPIIIVGDADNLVPMFAETLALPYLEADTKALYGVREGDYINDDIYPHRTGIVTSVDATNIYIFKDFGIDFDVNDYLLSGTPAKITFVSGQLSGYAFDVRIYIHSLKQFTINKNKDEKAFDIPSDELKPAIGDKYVLTDVSMPDAYVLAAEALLQVKAQEYLDINSTPSYQYTITCDPAYFRQKNIKMDIGSVVWLQDIELNIDKYIRVVGLSKSVVDEFEYTLQLGETITAGTIAAITASTATNTAQIVSTQRALEQNKLLNGVNVGDLKIEQGSLLLPDIKEYPNDDAAIADGLKYNSLYLLTGTNDIKILYVH